MPPQSTEDGYHITHAGLAEAKRVIAEWESRRTATTDPRERAMLVDMLTGALSVLVHLDLAHDLPELEDLTVDEAGTVLGMEA